MDTGRPGGDSSSPSDNRITDIRREGAGGEVARIDLSDGSSFFVATDLIQAEELAVGVTLSDAQLDRLLLAAEIRAAAQKALDLLAVREQPRARLELKLRTRGYGSDAVRAALDDLAASGKLDDLRFARLWVSGRARRNPCGRAALYAGLLNQGVGRRIAEEALRDWTDEDEANALRSAAERIGAGSDRAKTLRSLVRKGFSLTAANRYLDAIEPDL